ncbi:MAG: single-stranded DNA-binding protein [Verrucomicrobiales bacterium]
MPNLNKVMLMGNITRDPEVRYTPKGTAVTDISIAVNRTYTLDDGERREDTAFVDVTFWGRQAEVIGEYMKKGRPIYAEGRLQLDQWEDKNTGQQRSRLKVVGENFQFLGGRDDGGSGGGQSRGGGAQRGQESGGGQSEPPQQSGGGGQGEESHQSSPPRQTGGDSYDSPPPAEDDDIPF